MNKDYNLTYAQKDAEDIIGLFETKKENYSKTHIIKLVNQEATKENILKLKSFLSSSKVDDKVILFFAGHGLLEHNLDYYFGTYDIDFENPGNKGLAYSELENLMDGIASRKKLILIDTCHSGETDKEEIEIAKDDTIKNNVVTRAFRGIKVIKKINLENSFNLVEGLFNDLRKSSGAVVISSASGMEFAYEAEQWKNGVFTYSVLNGMNSGNADLNKDGKISVSELKDFVINNVSNLTNNKQTPTSRKENNETDFLLF